MCDFVRSHCADTPLKDRSHGVAAYPSRIAGIEYVDSGRIRIDIGATGHHRESGTFKAGGRLVPMDYWEGEDIDKS